MGLSGIKPKTEEAHPIKVLIADDDTPTRILLRAAVAQWGYEVVEASDGEEAWGLLQLPNLPQMMIVDWLMPKLDGIDLCRRMKNELKELPYIILLTQLSGTTNIVKGLEAGANEFLSKPFNMAELQSRLSVGARIVNYKRRLEHKSVKIKKLCSDAEEVSALMVSVAKKIENLITMGSADVAKLNDLQAEYKKLIAMFEAMNSELHQDGGE